MNDIAHPSTSGLSRVFSAALARADQWRELNAIARAWADSTTRGEAQTEPYREQCRTLLGSILRLEFCWAYPGTRLLGLLDSALQGGDATTFSRLVQKISAALLSGDFRRDEHAWEAGAEGDGTLLDTLPPDLQGGVLAKPYFEVLIVTPTDPETWPRAAEEMRRLRRPDDAFVYSVVHVGSFEDAALAAMVNTHLQSVILVDGFQYASRHDIPDLKAFLARHIRIETEPAAPGALATKSGSRPIERIARTGEFTPPGRTWTARS